MTARIYREVVSPGKLDETRRKPRKRTLRDSRQDLSWRQYRILRSRGHPLHCPPHPHRHLPQPPARDRRLLRRAFHDSEVFQYSKACVIRAESGILPEYRGSNQSIPFLTRQVLRYKLLNPGKRLLFLDTLIHPSSYALVTKYVDDVWPCHCDLESHHVKFLEHLIAQFSFKRSSKRSAGGRHRLDHHRGRSRTGTLGYAQQSECAFLPRSEPGISQGQRIDHGIPDHLEEHLYGDPAFQAQFFGQA